MRSPDPLAATRGLLLRQGRRRGGRGAEGRGGDSRGGKGREGKGRKEGEMWTPSHHHAATPLLLYITCLQFVRTK